MRSPVCFDPTVACDLRADPTAITYVADENPGYPCRQCLRDAEVGEELILIGHDPFYGTSPYRQRGPIFLHRVDCSSNRDESSIPEQLRRRQLSVRAFDKGEMMIDAEVVPGEQLESTMASMFANPETSFVDVHNATRGCWAARYEAS